MFDLSLQASNAVLRWANIALIAGATLVLGGTIAAIWASGIRERYADQRISKNEADTAAANAQAEGAKVEAARANESAANANERATKAQASLAIAEQHSVEANAKAESFRLNIAKANESAAHANEAAERERIARLQLEASLADRVITPEQQINLINILRRYRGQTVDVVLFGDSKEITNFGGAIISVLGRAGISINAMQLGGGGGTVRGVLVSVKPGTTPNIAQLAYLFIDALKQSVPLGVALWDFDKLAPITGVGRKLAGSDGLRTSAIQIDVGGK